ncbi:uncharacterized protein G2W53_010593 [Senna tora]|uniref:GAG-pre-integrase domain-containing protein n=1 Tax=Senna tora TaxID=362788 RepID=A0A834X070_9FABA|nr:uncharacterized protein G2W53_010593 [Senna tora]
MAQESDISKNSKSDQASYALHNSDNPIMLLVTTTLDGRNYLSWIIAVKTALEAKDKIGFVDGSIEAPEDSAEHKKWKVVDSMIKSWIVNSISKEFSDTFVCCRTAKDLWDVLEERFGVSNSLRQGGDSITVYYNKLHKCWDELERIMPMPTCTCGKCTCGLKKRVAEMMASMKLLQFLMGLNPIYDVVRTEILNLDSLPTVNKVFVMVATDESQREINMAYSSSTEGASAMMARSGQSKNEGVNSKKKDSSKKDKFCDHCNMNGHTRDTCFKIHGYPEWFKELREKRGGKKQVTKMAKDTGATEIPTGQETDSAVKGDLANVVSYLLKEARRLGKTKGPASKDEQVNFANLYDFAGTSGTQNSPNNASTHWVLDTGATTHMCSNKSLMHDIKPINYHKSVYLPDKSAKTIHCTGKEQKTKHVLAKGVAVDNIYYLDLEQTPECNRIDYLRCNKVNATLELNKTNGNLGELWHVRLGHPSLQALRHVKEIAPYLSENNALPHKDKFEPRAFKCIFIGYVTGQKAYKVYDLKNKRIIVSRDIVFYEGQFPFHNPTEGKELPLPCIPFSTDSREENRNDPLELPMGANDQEEDLELDTNQDMQVNEPGDEEEQGSHIQSLTNARAGTRIRKVPTWMQDYVCIAKTKSTGSLVHVVIPRPLTNGELSPGVGKCCVDRWKAWAEFGPYDAFTWEQQHQKSQKL